MRDRLIELIRQADDKCSLTKQCEECVAMGKGQECINFLIADYLLANGVIVPPCKVGDRVWFVHYNSGEVCEATIVSVEYNYYTSPQEWITVEYDSPFVTKNRYKTRIDLAFGKTVFLAQEEAERALKGGE